MTEHTNPQDNVSPEQPQDIGQSTPKTKTFGFVVAAIEGRVKGGYSVHACDGGYNAEVTVFAAGAAWILTKFSEDRQGLEAEYQAVVEAGGVSARGGLFVYRSLDPDPAAWALHMYVETLEPVVPSGPEVQ